MKSVRRFNDMIVLFFANCQCAVSVWIWINRELVKETISRYGLYQANVVILLCKLSI